MTQEPVKKLYLTDQDAALNNLYVAYKRGEINKRDFCFECEKRGFHPYLIAERFRVLFDNEKN